MEFRILGPLEVEDGSRAIAIAGRRQRELLGLLLLERNEVVAADQLLEWLWDQPASAASLNALHAAVSRLRRALPKERLLTKPPGYLLRVAPDELDAERFERLLAEGRMALSESGAEAGGELLRQALSLWSGSALSDFLYEPFAQTEIARLEELRLAGLEERIEADLALGRHAELVPELEALVADQPLRERPRGQLMLALYGSGRQADALELYRATRAMLLEELGLEPGPELRELERRILVQDVALELAAVRRPMPAPVPPAPTPVPETRKTVTVLFCDLADSTALTERLDPEVLREMLRRYAATASEAVAWHGGTMEKFIGDAVMAVFGVPRLHEDDAVRAVRAAGVLHERIAELAQESGLQLRTRIGIETGEVVAGDAGAGEALATGAAVAKAARLEQEAAPGEILIGEATRRLVASAVRVEPRGELALKGKQEGVTAWRLVELLPEAAAFVERLKTPLVGRGVELAQLRQTFGRALRERSPHLFTVFGPPGIGKTRLARELAEGVAGKATVLVGRCLSYGEGITFWLLRELLRQVPAGEHRARLHALLGADGGAIAATTEEIFVTAGRLLESLARERPLLVLLEDLHWAEPTFLDFVEYLAKRATDAPMLLLCLARPELLELRATWGGGMANASSLRLEPLADEEMGTLLDQLRADPSIRLRVKEVAEGNPLFAEQMLAWLEESGGLKHHRGLPPTIQAVLAARLDRLGPAETAIVHRAAVIGRDFETEAVAELLPREVRPGMARHLDALVGKGLVKPLRLEQEDDASFRFVHALVQEAAYRMVPKRFRAELHERFADWLRQTGSLHAEIVGHHLEQAYRYRAELGPIGEAERELAVRAGTTLSEAGLHARQRGDDAAAVALFSRGLALLPAEAPTRGAFLMGLGDSCTTGGDYRGAVAAYHDALAAAEWAGDEGLAWEAKLLRGLHESFLSPGRRSYEEYLREAKIAAEALEALGQERGIARAWNSVAIFEIWLGHLDAGAKAAERAATFAHRVRDWHLERASLSWLAESLLEGPTPTREGVRRCEEILARADNADLRSRMHRVLGDLHAMLGHADEARDLHELALAEAEELGLKRRIAAIESLFRAFAATLAPTEAEARLRRSLRLWEEMEVIGAERPGVAATLAWTLCEQGRRAEAEQYAALAERLAPADDYISLSLTRAVRAQVLARKGDVEQAYALAREAVAIIDRTDNIDERGWLRTDVADVLTLAGKDDEALSVLEEALHLAEQKEDFVLVERARARLAELQTSGPLR